MEGQDIPYIREKFLTREESLGIKGLTMLLIILGHCKGIILHRIGIYFWLYTFHVALFFIIPWFYQYKYRPICEVALKGFFRFIIPYIIFYSISFILFNSIYAHTFDIGLFFSGLFILDTSVIAKTAGIQTLWFLPVFYIFTILMQWMRNEIKKREYISLLFLLLSALVFAYSYEITSTGGGNADIFLWLRKISLMIACAISCVEIIKRLQNKYFQFYIAACAIIFTVSAIYYIVIINSIVTNWSLYIILPICAFSLLYWKRNYISKCKLFVEIGKYSFSIYLIHIFIMKFCEAHWGLSVPIGVMNYIIVIVISYFISRTIYAWRLDKFIFPNFTAYKKEIKK